MLAPVTIQRTSSVAMKADSPMVKLGKMMWNVDREGELQTREQDGIEVHRYAPI